jgi:hypothetical protein
MRATTRLTVGLAVLTAGLALTACGTTTTAGPDAKVRPCRTSSLTWTLTLLDGTGQDGGRPGARLTAANKGPATPLPLPRKAAVTVDIRYAPGGTKDAGPNCVRQPEAAAWAPHDAARAVVPVLDARRRPTTIDACGQSMSPAPPRLR